MSSERVSNSSLFFRSICVTTGNRSLSVSISYNTSPESIFSKYRAIFVGLLIHLTSRWNNDKFHRLGISTIRDAIINLLSSIPLCSQSHSPALRNDYTLYIRSSVEKLKKIYIIQRKWIICENAQLWNHIEWKIDSINASSVKHNNT